MKPDGTSTRGDGEKTRNVGLGVAVGTTTTVVAVGAAVAVDTVVAVSVGSGVAVWVAVGPAMLAGDAPNGKPLSAISVPPPQRLASRMPATPSNSSQR